MRIGRWELLARLGQGGMGEVWRARDPQSGEEVALKRLLTTTPDAEELLRFQREAQLLLRLRHPAIVAWRDAGRDEAGCPWVAMELVAGGTLEALVAKEGPLAPARAAALGVELCAALAALHASGALHRDLKPANVLLDPQGRAKLTDFGLARPTGRGGTLTQTGTIMGSPGYMAPEQVRGDRSAQGPATDVYGLGGVLYFLLTGQAPFRATSVLRCLQSILEDPARAPSTVRPGVPPELDRLVLRCLAKSPADRYPSTAALRAALEAELQPGRARSTAGRRWIRLVAGLSAATACCAGGVGLLALHSPGGSPAPQAGSTPVIRGAGPLASDATPVETPSPATRERDELQRVALELVGRGDLPGARAALDRALALEPRDHIALVNRGAVCELEGDQEGALTFYDRAVAARPDSADSWLARGMLRVQREELALARRDLDRALTLQPGNVDALIWRGRTRQKIGDLEGALEDIDQGLSRDPSRPDGLVLRATILQLLGRHAAARVDLDRALELDPRNRLALRDRAGLRQKDDLPGALEDLDRRLAIDEDPECLAIRGALHARARHWQAAREDLERCLELAPGAPKRAEIEGLLKVVRGHLGR